MTESRWTPPPAPEPDDGPAAPTLVLTSVGLPYGDRLATWDAAGTVVLFAVPDDLQERIGQGQLPRSAAGQGITVEAVVVDQHAHVIHGAGDDAWPATMLLEPGGAIAGEDLQEKLRTILVSAARRGESVILAPGGLSEFAPPAARASVILDADGDWVSVVEAFPPLTHEGWALGEHDEHSSRLSAPASEAGLQGAALLLLMAAQTFTRGPELVGVYYEAAPDGPWPV